MKVLNIERVRLSDVLKRSGNRSYILATNKDEILEIDSYCNNKFHHNSYLVIKGFAKVIGRIKAMCKVVLVDIEDTSELEIVECNLLTIKNSPVHSSNIVDVGRLEFVNCTYPEKSFLINTRFLSGFTVEGKFPTSFGFNVHDLNGNFIFKDTRKQVGSNSEKPSIIIFVKRDLPEGDLSFVSLYEKTNWDGDITVLGAGVRLEGFVDSLDCHGTIIGEDARINYLRTARIEGTYDYHEKMLTYYLDKVFDINSAHAAILNSREVASGSKLERVCMITNKELGLEFNADIKQEVDAAIKTKTTSAKKVSKLIDCCNMPIVLRKVSFFENGNRIEKAGFVFRNFHNASGKAGSVVILDSPKVDMLPDTVNLWMENSKASADVVQQIDRLSDLVMDNSKAKITAKRMQGVKLRGDSNLHLTADYVGELAFDTTKAKLTGKIGEVSSLTLVGDNIKGLSKILGKVHSVLIGECKQETVNLLAKEFPNAVITFNQPKHWKIRDVNNTSWKNSNKFSPEAVFHERDGNAFGYIY